jgi:hypothetical protein
MKLATAHLAQTWVREDVTSWENEGGAIRSAPEATQNPVMTVGWPPSSVIESVPAARGGADKGMRDTNSLTILRLSLLLLVPALGSMAIFWGAFVLNGPQ